MAKRRALAAPYAPGAKAYWLNPDTGQWHPVTVKFPCCEASGPEPMYQIVDEFGWGHLVYPDRLKPRADGPDYRSRPAGPRKGET